MSPSRPFILRPLATFLLMVGLLLVGAVAYYQLPVSALPQVDYPTIQVLTFYPGASSDVMASAVTATLERQFGQVPGLNQMTSTSAEGCSVITLQFALDLNIDVAQQDVQAAINVATTFLPSDLPNPPVYSKINPADAPILTQALTSKTLHLSEVEDLADTRLVQKISQLPGVGLVSLSGGADSGAAAGCPQRGARTPRIKGDGSPPLGSRRGPSVPSFWGQSRLAFRSDHQAFLQQHPKFTTCGHIYSSLTALITKWATTCCRWDSPASASAPSDP
jgi:hypothetical protein